MGLSEPKVKQRIQQDPRNSSWSKDKSKFGWKLMERMGWKEGSGLGAREDGCLSHVRVAKKDNQLGVGADRRSADNWLEHNDAFNELLSKLQADATNIAMTATDCDHGLSVPVVAEASSQDCGVAASAVAKRNFGRFAHRSKFLKAKLQSTANQADLSDILGSTNPARVKDAKLTWPLAVNRMSDKSYGTGLGFSRAIDTDSLHSNDNEADSGTQSMAPWFLSKFVKSATRLEPAFQPVKPSSPSQSTTADPDTVEKKDKKSTRRSRVRDGPSRDSASSRSGTKKLKRNHSSDPYGSTTEKDEGLKELRKPDCFADRSMSTTESTLVPSSDSKKRKKDTNSKMKDSNDQKVKEMSKTKKQNDVNKRRNYGDQVPDKKKKWKLNTL